MSAHGEVVSGRSQRIWPIYDEEGRQIRVLLYEEWYDFLKPIYDWCQLLLEGVSVNVGFEEVAPALQQSFEWLSGFTTYSVDFGPVGLTFVVVGWVARLVENKIDLGKFSYESFGRLGESRLGERRLGGGIRLVEYPVEQ